MANGAHTKKKQTQKGTAKKSQAQGARTQFLNDSIRLNLIGLALIALGVILFLCMVHPGTAIVSSAICAGTRLLMGIVAFPMPFAFIIWGVFVFLKEDSGFLGRLVLGLALILLSLMSIFALHLSGFAVAEPGTLFEKAALIAGGGYIGSGIAWALLKLFGRAIATVILLFVIVAGGVLFGLSISKYVIYLRDLFFSAPAAVEDEPAPKRRRKREPEPEEDEEFEVGVRHGRQMRVDEVVEDFEAPTGDETVVLGNKKRRRRKEPELLIEPDVSNFEDPAPLPAPATIVLDPAEVEEAAAAARKGATVAKKSRKKAKEGEEAAHSPLEGYTLPPMQLLRVTRKRQGTSTNELKQTADLLKQTLDDFKLPVEIVGWLNGPTVTMFKVELPQGVRLSKLTSLADDIALALAAQSVRIAQIPNTSLVGVEIPNRTRSSILLGDVLNSAEKGPLQLAIGEDVDGQNVCVDLAKMPHLLIGGTTGSGKSVSINSMIMSILMRATPAEVRMIMIDPKRVELSLYNGIPHLYVPVVTEPKEAAAALKWGVVEMERRLKIFEQAGARNIGLYNQMVQSGKLDSEDGERPQELPFIVIIIDELADLMMVAGKDVEDSICRIAQLARAAGIHLIVATQRPSSNVVTGMIKANITNRIAFNVATSIDSRVILDQPGADKLVGLGDMLFSKPEWGKPKRIQGCFVTEAETEAVVAHLKDQGTPDYHPEILQQQVNLAASSGGNAASLGMADDEDDPLIWEAADAVITSGMGSTSMLQRRLKVGYARAGRIMDMLETKGIVGPPDGSRAREVLIDSVEDLEAIRAFEQVDVEGF